jgi:hypothetical protein
MPIRMAKLTRDKNGDFASRKGIPKDVRDAYTRLYRGTSKAALRITKKGGQPTAPKVWEELFSLPGSTSPNLAKVAWAEWCADIDTKVAGLRAAARGEGQPLTRINALALAGRWWSASLLELADKHRVPLQSAINHFAFKYELPTRPLQRRTAKTTNSYTRKQVRGSIMAFDDTPVSARSLRPTCAI